MAKEEQEKCSVCGKNLYYQWIDIKHFNNKTYCSSCVQKAKGTNPFLRNILYKIFITLALFYVSFIQQQRYILDRPYEALTIIIMIFVIFPLILLLWEKFRSHSNQS